MRKRKKQMNDTRGYMYIHPVSDDPEEVKRRKQMKRAQKMVNKQVYITFIREKDIYIPCCSFFLLLLPYLPQK